ncbi:hypothetical protein VIGAN_06135200 [Vigna angularis var. angularis]|uniref:SGNH hydrolase-type esterase domain-containing protein n=1 Tax=Vigna angularis var. angularis TaxID=157739 RepID=A0A0S3SBH3_PHAAN|nr:hypothetical protein VIGAN_06135200 [Vigna angularis var. angularis]
MFFFEVPFSKLFLVVLWSFSTVIISLVNVVSLPNNYSVPAVFVFGDSIVDTGNNNYIKTIAKCDFRPYGKDFGGGNQPTGRFSNGLVPSDIIGFEVADKGCCGTGDFEVGFLCNPVLKICSNRSTYIFWDSFHPTERAFNILSSEVLDKNINKFF